MNTQEKAHALFKDQLGSWPLLGANWEKLGEAKVKQVDFDGSYEYSTEVEVIVSINNAETFSLFQNYPNPFNSSTTIVYGLQEDVFVSLIVYDCLGKNVQTLVNKFQKAGTHRVVFESSNLPSGIYFYRLQAGSFVETKKMILLK